MALHSLLMDVLGRPSAPFRESHVIAAIEAFLASLGVPSFRDPLGNVVVGAADRKAVAALIAQPSGEPLRLFVAHLDHPGFHGVRWTRGALEARWLGGSPVKGLRGAKVWLADAMGYRGEGKIGTARLNPRGTAMQGLVIRVKGDALRHFDAAALFGGFAFRRPVWQVGSRLYTKAADDLVGACVVALLAARAWAEGKPRLPFLGLLTRAEEVGFIGMIGHLELGWLRGKRRIVCVSLETSRQLPGAVSGAGPVARLGDRATVFDPGSLQVLLGAAEAALPGRFQKRVMDGGTCEATVATAYGFPAIGISVPLGNYHNQNFDGGPDARVKNGPAPEFVDLRDVDGMLRLSEALLEPGLPWAEPWAARVEGFRRDLEASRGLLAV